MIDPLAPHGSFGGANYEPYYHEFNHSSRSPLPADYRSSSTRSNSNSRDNYQRNSLDNYGSGFRSGSTCENSLHSSSSARGDPTQASTQSSQGTETQSAPGDKQRLFVQNLPPFYEETHLA